jgi:SAM-dependent methyltransferase
MYDMSLRRFSRKLLRHLRRHPASSGNLQPYEGVCNLCGATGIFEPGNIEVRFVARSYACPDCGAALRFRNEAAAIVEEFGRGRHLSLRTLVEDAGLAGLSVYNIGIAGPVRVWLRRFSRYVESTFFEGGRSGEVRDGVHHQDIQHLTFADGSFDLVASSHVMEHVPDPDAAIAEIFRVLRPGGRCIFSVPVFWPPPEKSATRASLENGRVVHHLPEVYHQSPGGAPSLVFTDFGTDLLESLEAAGFFARQRRPNIGVAHAFRDSVFVAVKPSVSGAP